MAVVTTLPTPPSRVENPVTFHIDSWKFLDRLKGFKDEVNAFCKTLSVITVYKWNMGYIKDEFKPSPDQYPYKHPEGVGVQFISDADRLYSQMYKNVFYYNGVSDWVKDVEKKYGKQPSNKPFPITLLTPPQSKSQNKTLFNETATAFTQSNMDNLRDVKAFIASVQDSIKLQIDCGRVTEEELDEFIDSGWVTDKNIATEEIVDTYHLYKYNTNRLRQQVIKTTLEVFRRDV